MSVAVKPALHRYTCDGCSLVVEPTVHGRPKHWSELVIHRDLYDFQGMACADGTLRRDLCADCSNTVYEAINKTIKERKHV